MCYIHLAFYSVAANNILSWNVHKILYKPTSVVLNRKEGRLLVICKSQSIPLQNAPKQSTRPNPVRHQIVSDNYHNIYLVHSCRSNNTEKVTFIKQVITEIQLTKVRQVHKVENRRWTQNESMLIKEGTYIQAIELVHSAVCMRGEAGCRSHSRICTGLDTHQLMFVPFIMLLFICIPIFESES